jgi:hypothetical protein
MLQPNELKTGNFVLYNTIGSVPLSDYRFEKPKELCKVTGFDGDKVVLEFMDESVRKEFSPEVHTAHINISPVHLTEDILKACQLESNKTNLKKLGNVYHFNGTEVKYLHQLQNKFAEAEGRPLMVQL